MKTTADICAVHRAMETQESRRLKGNRYSMEPIRHNPKRTEAGNDSIQDAEVWGAPAGSVENQQLMFGENGFCDDGPHAARANDTDNRCDQMNYEDYQMPHEQSYQSLKA